MAAFATGTAIGITYNANLPLVSIGGFLLIYLFENFRRPVGVAYISSIIDDSIMATVLSTDSQLSAITASLIALLMGFLSDLVGVGYGIMASSLILLVLSAFMRLPDTSCEKKEQEEN